MDISPKISPGKVTALVCAPGLSEERISAAIGKALAGRSFALCSYADVFYPDISIRKNVRMLRASMNGRSRALFSELLNLTGWKKKSSYIRPFRAHMTGEKRLFSMMLAAALAQDAFVLPEPMIGIDPDSRALFPGFVACCAAHGISVIFTADLKDALETGAAPELVLVSEGGEKAVSRAEAEAKRPQEGEVSYDEIFKELAGA